MKPQSVSIVVCYIMLSIFTVLLWIFSKKRFCSERWSWKSFFHLESFSFTISTILSRTLKPKTKFCIKIVKMTQLLLGAMQEANMYVCYKQQTEWMLQQKGLQRWCMFMSVVFVQGPQWSVCRGSPAGEWPVAQVQGGRPLDGRGSRKGQVAAHHPRPGLRSRVTPPPRTYIPGHGLRPAQHRKRHLLVSNYHLP